MPRRPRPATRNPPRSKLSAPLVKEKGPYEASHINPAPNVSNPKSRIQIPHDDSESEPESEQYPLMTGSDVSSEEDEDSTAGSSGSAHEMDDLNADAQPDAPRVAQWVDDDDFGGFSEQASESEEEADDSRLEADLLSFSFGALRKARKALAKAQPSRDSEEEVHSDADVSQLEEEPSAPTPRLDKGKEGDEFRPQKEITKRKNKHAPMEMSSKRPVSRSRFVAEKVVPRDPRFLSVTGNFDAQRFHTQYGFLSGMHQDELKTLRNNLKRARKLLANSPRDLREEREAEVERLERAVKRAESVVNKDHREKVEKEALSHAAQEEREKRKQGKGTWYLKDADKKALLLRAKYAALAATGGNGAVRKAIDKKQKKDNQKEKKKRPFVAGPSTGSISRNGYTRDSEGHQFRKRPRLGNEDGSRKRLRLSS